LTLKVRLKTLDFTNFTVAKLGN